MTHLFIGLANQRAGPLAAALRDILHGLIILHPLVISVRINR